MSTKYEKCQKRKMNNIMHEFKEGKLKSRSNKTIKSRKQAVAIGLSIANSKCLLKMNENDYEKIEDKFNKNMNKKLTITSVKNGIKLAQHYQDKNNYKKVSIILNKLFIRLLKDIKNGEKVNELILNDILNFIN